MNFNEAGKDHAPTVSSLRLRWGLPLAAFVLGTVASLLTWYALRALEDQSIHRVFLIKSEERVAAIRAEIANALDELEDLRAFYAGSQLVDRTEFQTFVAATQSQELGLDAVYWAPRIVDADRPAYQRASGIDGSELPIRQRDAKGRLVIAERQDVYYPITYAVSFVGDSLTPGENVYANPDFVSAVDRATYSGNCTVTARVETANRDGTEYGVYAVVPVYRNGAPVRTAAERRAALHGVIIGRLMPRVVLANAISNLQHEGIELELSDRSAARHEQPLCRHRSRGVREITAAGVPATSTLSGRLHVERELRVGGRRWQIHSAATPEYVAARRTWWPFASLAAGLLFSSLVSGYVRTMSDRFDRKLRDQQAMLSNIINNSPYAIYWKDRQSVVLGCNPVFARAIGFERPEDVVGLKDTDWPLPPEEVEHYRRSEQQVIETGEPLLNQEEALTAGGETRILMTSRVPLRDADRNVLGVLGIWIDVTDRKRTMLELELAKKGAEQASEAKSQFLAAMSHELRTPLNGVIGMTELLYDSDLDDRQQQFVHTCRTSAKLLMSLINDILDFSKIEAGKLELDEHEFQLFDLVDAVIEMMVVRLGSRPIELLYSVNPQADLRVKGDSGRLQQILVNLLGNALKFTEAGEVALRVEPNGIASDRCTILFSVRDTGIGIPADRVGRLFQSFSQVDSSTSRKYGGTGLGLAICKGLVEAMGGQIGVKSHEGSGSEFWFTVPYLVVPGNAARQANVPDRLSNLRALVVDDNPASCRGMQEMLSAWGTHAAVAHDARTALERLHAAHAANEPFDLTILDQSLPDEDGTVLAEWISADRQLASLKLFLLAPFDARLSADRMRQLGIDRCLHKPVGRSQLLKAITEAFSHAAGDASAAGGNDAALSPAQDNANQNAHILLAEDNDVNRFLAQEILKKAGLSCDVARNGAEAVRAVRNKRYDLILMDCQMPDMDGFEATRAIRQLERQGHVTHRPVIVALTANAIKGDRERCLAAGMDDYLSKPFQPAQLIDVVRRSITGPLQRREELRWQSLESPSAEPAAAPPLNTDELLSRSMNDLVLAEGLLRQFETRAPQACDDVARHASARDAAGVADSAHALKGMSASVSADGVRSAAAALEAAGRAATWEGVEDLVAKLRAEIDQCLEYIPKVSSSAPPTQAAADELSART